MRHVLTETKATEGSQFFAEAFTAADYAVTFPDHAPGELGVMIVSKLRVTPDPLGAAMDYLPARAAGVVVDTTDGPLRVVGAYVPSRDATAEKTERNKTWIQRFGHALDSTARDAPLLLGDLNVLEPTHQPAHRGQFAPLEYAFTLAERLTACGVCPRDQAHRPGKLPAHQPFQTRRAPGADRDHGAANLGPRHGGHAR